MKTPDQIASEFGRVRVSLLEGAATMRRLEDDVRALATPTPVPDPEPPSPPIVSDAWPHVRVPPARDYVDDESGLPGRWGHDRVVQAVHVHGIYDPSDRGFLHRVALAQSVVEECEARSNRYAMFASAGLTDVVFDHCIFRGERDEAAVRVYNAERVVFHACVFETGPENAKHSLRLFASRDVLFEDCRFVRGRVQVGGPDRNEEGRDPLPVTDVVFRRCVFEHEGVGHPFEPWACSGVRFRDCRWTSTSRTDFYRPTPENAAKIAETGVTP